MPFPVFAEWDGCLITFLQIWPKKESQRQEVLYRQSTFDVFSSIIMQDANRHRMESASEDSRRHIVACAFVQDFVLRSCIPTEARGRLGALLPVQALPAWQMSLANSSGYNINYKWDKMLDFFDLVGLWEVLLPADQTEGKLVSGYGWLVRWQFQCRSKHKGIRV